jgi:DNA mismatch repair protein MutL
MAKIHKLSYHEAQKIAAGEVVERPANVVKELVENALDAGATTISVFIEDGGKALIRVVDNGCGMSAEDAHLSFEHHATSKITSVNDLETISTFGFRGEALSSIASISRVTLITNENTADAGVKLVREGNELIDEQPVAAPRGTDFVVRDIFYNVPARLKFLKKRETEFNQIHTLFQAYSLASPQLHWQFSSEGSVLHNCAPTEDLQQRVVQLFDQRLAQSLIPCLHTTKDGSVTISGVITDNTYARYDRSDIFFFVNQRWIKNQPLARALLKGYANTLPPGRFPAACLFITVKSDAVDINVHPRKEEVLFLHPKVVETALCGMVSTALEQGLSSRLQQTTQSAPTNYSYSSSAYQAPHSLPLTNSHLSTSAVYQQSNSSCTVDSEGFLNTPYTAHHKPLFFGNSRPLSQVFGQKEEQNLISQSFLNSEPFIDEPLTTSAEFDQNFDKDEPLLTLSHQQIISTTTPEEQVLQRHTIIGQLHKTYIMLEHPDGLYVVDQHAAHERIIYERLAQRFEEAATIQLLFPIIVSVGVEHSERLLPHLALLHQIGIGIEQFSPTEVIITATPVQAQTVDYAELIRTIIGWLHEYDNLDTAELSRQVNEKLRAQIACKAAVKAGDELTREQMEQLLVDLSKTDNRFSCPHGRPTGWLLGTYEIEKRFRRKQ